MLLEKRYLNSKNARYLLDTTNLTRYLLECLILLAPFGRSIVSH